jgi:hypothetical protein
MLAMKLKARKTQPGSRLLWLGIFSSMPLSAFLTTTSARAQEGLADDMANESQAKARTAAAESSDYTFKSGDFRMLLTPAFSAQWNDNVNLVETGKQEDFILLPTLGVTMTYPLTQRNLLQLSVTGGYSEYLLHPHLSSWYLASGTGLSFDLYIKDILLNLHDQFSYVQNSAESPEVANTGSYGIFGNTAGFSSDWSLKYFDFTVGYDHITSLATSAQFDDTDDSVESAYTRLGYNWNPKITTGFEGTLAYTAYNQDVFNDNTSYSAGVYGTWSPDSALSIEPRVGYSIDQFDNNSRFLHQSNLDSWYADLSVTHQITKFVYYSLDAGRNIGAGVQSDADKYWYANAGITWNFIRNFSLQPKLFFQHGNAGIGTTEIATPPSGSPVVSEIYNWYGGSIGLNYQLTKRFTVGWNYQYTKRTSSVGTRGYTQNIIGLQVTYNPI